ncbi:PREDICTED: choline transporter-like protein 1 [Dinoponera quadriceps]|uniref:Choline transporter-like protein n=1 Tax=Dinoponera quadriceps TaxID=609295 RepID=A0A6P3X8L2_DINQU|nr:PREDICTED: choline transporter-like protein 1 [Dinoponera quadriceps]XP_014474758.1 PREDICTED: choline transporter-like protein 1 [Dinoponera quadriceps]XP_014474759.1 PREDICTED: choline transporter-like protein 1 [Dinoponera quadriceps]XP_014474760.1 PREDICTED: choline transporter-like protein 1 [Dinoponera quadriceps]XP_014474761.1 PREDICTED: choline transporter-like protein 1 [Dinoponera quadriceps]
MGCCGCADEPSSKVEPTTPENQNSPSSYSEQIFVKNRSCTDVLALVILLALVGGFAYMMTNVANKGDIFRVINGYDDCGFVCGRVTPNPEINPRAQCRKENTDMTKKRYLEIEMDATGVKKRTCVENCDSTAEKPKMQFLNRCVNKQVSDTINSIIRNLHLDSFYREAVNDLGVAWRELVYLLLIALAISLAILVAFRYLVQWIVYIVLIGVIIACIGGTTYFWLAWYQENNAVKANAIPAEDSSVQPYFVYAIIMSVVTAIILLVVLVMRKRIALVMQLFREAGKAVCAMPALLFQPIYTYLLIGFTMIAWIYFMLWIESAGDIYENKKHHIHFRKDGLLIATRWYNLFLFFVACEFYLGCQHLLVACAVARWFFTRDKKRLSFAVTRGFGYLVRYHLGTVAVGALLIGIVRLIRAMISFVQNHLKRYDNGCVQGILWCCQCCIWCFECALKFLTRNAYIETAIYGCNFCTSGRKAFQALSSNVLRVAAINSVGDFVLFLGKVLVITLTAISGVYLMQKKEGLHHPWVPITIAGIFAFLVAHCFISIYEMIIDTIFICFCEDCEKNDGVGRPYFMSRGLMEFVENSKKALRHLDQRQETAAT